MLITFLLLTKIQQKDAKINNIQYHKKFFWILIINKKLYAVVFLRGGAFVGNPLRSPKETGFRQAEKYLLVNHWTPNRYKKRMTHYE